MAIPAGFDKQFSGGMANKNGENSPFAGALKNHFNGQIGAFAYLLFVLLYFPCIATTATAYRETNKGWAIFMVIWATGLAYLAGTLFYQVDAFWVSCNALLAFFDIVIPTRYHCNMCIGNCIYKSMCIINSSRPKTR